MEDRTAFRTVDFRRLEHYQTCHKQQVGGGRFFWPSTASAARLAVVVGTGPGDRLRAKLLELGEVGNSRRISPKTFSSKQR
jgi:hypothetical protein